MENFVLYIHGQGGSARESAHYQPLFPDHTVIGVDYHASTPGTAGREIQNAAKALEGEAVSITLIANSIGAYFSMCAGIDHLLQRAYFISPVVDLEGLILDRMRIAGVTEAQLRTRGSIATACGETLSWSYLCDVRAHPVRWTVPTEILYGGRDELTGPETVRGFAAAHHARLTVMENGTHWFHTEEQMRFLDGWMQQCEQRRRT